MVALDQSLALTHWLQLASSDLDTSAGKKRAQVSNGFFVGERKCFLIKFHTYMYFGHVNIYKEVMTYYSPGVSFEFKPDSMNSSEDLINFPLPTFSLANLHCIVSYKPPEMKPF